MMVCHDMFVQLVNVSIVVVVLLWVSVFVTACCSVVLDVWQHPDKWFPYLSNLVPHNMYFLVWLMMGSCSLRISSLCNQFEGSLHDKFLCSAMIVSGLSKLLGRNILK